MAATPTPTLSSVSGTQVLFHPVPTPWPFSAGCDRYIYRQANGGLMLAFDPMYPSIIDNAAQSCFHTEMSSWWLQPTDASPSTALGPLFQCPESYSTVLTSLLSTNAAATTQYIYCCPPNFRSGTIFPQNIRSVAQCVSVVPVGKTISFMSLGFSNGGLIHTPVSTAFLSAATVFAPPINGYNVVQKQAVQPNSNDNPNGRSSTLTTSNAEPTSPPPAQGPSSYSSTIAIAVISSLLGIIILGLAGFFLWRRRKQRQQAGQLKGEGAGTPELAGNVSTRAEVWGDDITKMYYSENPAVTEMPNKYGAPTHELPQEEHRDRHEMGAHERRYEMGVRSQRFELPGV